MQYQATGRSCQNCGAAVTSQTDLLCPICKQHYASPAGIVAASWGTRFGAWVLDVLLAIITLLIGWLLWALIVTFKNGQTPGKAIVGIRAARSTGEPATWGLTFVREIVIKGIVVGILGNITSGIFTVVNYLWPLWDRNLQALHDKMVSTVVVQQGVTAVRVQQSQPGDPWGPGSAPPPPGSSGGVS